MPLRAMRTVLVRSLIWVADDNSVVQANGTPNPLKISPPDLDRLIAAVSDKTTLEASVYISQGHPKWVISCAAFTWEFDLGSQKWNERASYQQPRWRGVSGINAFGKWIVGDTQGGRLLYVNSAAYDEFGSPLVMQIESGSGSKLPEPDEGGAGGFQIRYRRRHSYRSRS